MAIAGIAQAQTYQILYSFKGAKDGANPESATLIHDSHGNLYGTTQNRGAFGYGTAFRLSVTGKLTVLHQFAGGEDGAYPDGGLILKAGTFYGTTQSGGAFNQGTVFKLYKGQETILHSFAGSPNDGSDSYADLISDQTGNLYGVTPYGGSNSCGTVFKIDPTDTETILHNFTGGDGCVPTWTLFLDAKSGNFYGTTIFGGSSGSGTVFKLDPSGTETVLYNFASFAGDGDNPNGGVVRDWRGNLYGSTWNGGSSGNGTAFRLSTTGKETILHNFTGGDDGGQAMSRLVRDFMGNVYGTTNAGGTSGCGTVYKLAMKTGQLTVLHEFTCADGANPDAGMLRDKAGNLYGTTYNGGAHGRGVIFQITP